MAVTVASLMTPEPVVVDAATDVLVCARLMESREIGTVGVVMDGRLSGVLTDRDIVTRAVARNRDPRPIPSPSWPQPTSSPFRATPPWRKPSSA